MPTTFDFVDTSTGWASNAGTGGWVLTNTVDGVRFTVSDPAAGVLTAAAFGNGSTPSSPFYLFASGSNESFSLRLTNTLQPSQNQFSGTAANKVNLVLGNPTGVPLYYTGTWKIQFMNGTSVIQTNTATSGYSSFSAQGQFTAIKFTSLAAGDSYISLNSLTVNNLNCFCAGTLIDTLAGKRPVEELMAGDKVLTADGKETTVHWLGTQLVDTKLRHPKMVNPICITAGALGGGLPERDLFLSQDHAVAIDGTLYNAGALVNGETIYQVAEMPLEGFTYYHVETDAHELLVAEGVAAESYIDYAGREGFDNAEAGSTREITEMDLPRVSAARMVPEYLKPRKVA